MKGQPKRRPGEIVMEGTRDESTIHIGLFISVKTSGMGEGVAMVDLEQRGRDERARVRSEVEGWSVHGPNSAFTFLLGSSFPTKEENEKSHCASPSHSEAFLSPHTQPSFPALSFSAPSPSLAISFFFSSAFHSRSAAHTCNPLHLYRQKDSSFLLKSPVAGLSPLRLASPPAWLLFLPDEQGVTSTLSISLSLYLSLSLCLSLSSSTHPFQTKQKES